MGPWGHFMLNRASTAWQRMTFGFGGCEKRVQQVWWVYQLLDLAACEMELEQFMGWVISMIQLNQS